MINVMMETARKEMGVVKFAKSRKATHAKVSKTGHLFAFRRGTPCNASSQST